MPRSIAVSSASTSLDAGTTLPAPVSAPTGAARALEPIARADVRLGVGPRPYVPALDGLRGVAIAMVLAFHIAGYLWTKLGVTLQPGALQAVLEALLVGWAGVDLFFVLSGYLITGILLETRAAPRYYTNFYARRALRIFPLYFAVLGAVFLLVPWVAPYDSPGMREASRHQLYLWTYTTNIGRALYDINFARLAHFWSLSVEEHFYLFWPLLVRARRPWVLPLACAACVVVACASRWALADRPPAAHVFTLCRVDSLAIGAALVLAERALGVARLRRWLAKVAIPCALGLLALVPSVRSALGMSPAAFETIVYLPIAAASALLLGWAVTAPGQHWLVRLLSAKPLRALGKYSYGVYVLHVPVLPFAYVMGQGALAAVGAKGEPAVVAVVFGLLAAAASYGAAWLSWHLLEKHCLALKRFFEPARALPALGEPQSSNAMSSSAMTSHVR